MRIMVVGASGVLGKLVCTELIRIFNSQLELVISDYKEDRGKQFADLFDQHVKFQYIDVSDDNSILKGIKDADIVIVVLKQRTPFIQKVCIARKILCIDVTPFADFVDQVRILHKEAQEMNIATIVMAGFFPGLSALMARKATLGFERVSTINIGLLQNTNAKAGISGIVDMLKIISNPVDYSEDEKVIQLSGFSQKRKMHFLSFHNEREVSLIDHGEKLFLQKRLNIKEINYWTAWNSPFFNHLIAVLKSFGVLNFLNMFDKNKILSKIVKHNPNKGEEASLTVEVTGYIVNKKYKKIISLSTFSDYHLTAMVTAALAKVAVSKKVTGVIFPFEVTDLDEILSVINCEDIEVSEIIKEEEIY